MNALNGFGYPKQQPTAYDEPPAPQGKLTATWNTMAESKSAHNSKKAFDWGWKKLMPVGEWMNKKAGAWGVEGFWPVDIPRECEKCARILWTFAQARQEEFVSASNDPHSQKKTQKIVKRIPPEVIEKAEGLAIYTVWRMGLGLSAASGSGIIIARDTPTSWGPPSGILVHTIGWGFLAGSDVYDVVLVLRNKKAVEAFCKPKISLGADIAAVAGPQGSGAAISSGIEGAPIFSYTKSKGLYGGVALDGNIILARDDENERFYGRRLKTRDLLLGGNVAIPHGAEVLYTVIEAAEGRTIDERMLPNDIGIAPSDMPAANGPNAQAAEHGQPIAAAAGTTGSPPLPKRRNVPPPPPKLNDDDELIKSPLPPTGSAPPRPPRRFVPNSPNASPRVSSEHARLSGESPRLSNEQPRLSSEAHRVSGEHTRLAELDINDGADNTPTLPAYESPFSAPQGQKLL